MNDYEKLVPLECRQLVEMAIGQARENLSIHGHLAMVAFVGAFGDGCSIMMLEGMGTKAKAAQALAQFVRQQDPDYVLHICEMYMLKMKAKTAEEARELEREANARGVKAMPGSVEGVAFQLETGMGHFLMYCELETKGKLKTFTKNEFMYLPNYRGTFANLLPKAKTK